MKKWLANILDHTKRLWCQLAISYTLLAFCASTLSIALFYGLDDYNDFHRAVTVDNVRRQVTGEMLAAAQVIRDPTDAAWRDKVRDSIREKLTSIEGGNNSSIYRITRSSRPEVYIQITDENGRVLMTDPAYQPGNVASQFAGQISPPPKSHVVRLKENGPIWVVMPITAGHSVVGYLRVLYIAEFSLWVELQSVLEFVLFLSGALFLCSVPIGIACALVASRYLTKQLQKMNEVTENWRQGNFVPRIKLPNDDVLIRHSQHLNGMAQDLEMYLGLKQSLAVTDERNRVARELHDTVKQKLFALGLQLATAKVALARTDAAREHVLEAEAITREAQRDVMEIITQLRPAGAADASFFERIGIVADDFRRRFGVAIELSRTGAARLSALGEHHVLRIIQEALINAVRHGKASAIAIAGQVDGDTATLSIADNGIGFDTKRKCGGFGIVSMRDRVRELSQGTLDIQSSESTGTIITLSWKNET